MLVRISHFTKTLGRSERGGIAVEFAIILPVLALLVFGIVDFGHAWYMKNLVQNAVREGARYGSRYQTDASGNRVLPKNLSPSIGNYILHTPAQNGGSGCSLASLLPTSANPAVTPTGTAYTESNVKNLPLEDLTITATARKNWFVIHKLVPGITQSYTNITVSTTVKCE